MEDDNMNVIYNEPEFNIVCANTEDILTASGFGAVNGFTPPSGGASGSGGFGDETSTGLEL